MTIFSGAIKLNLENASFHKGIFVESSLVLAEGEFDDGILNVTAFGFPPTEPASKTRDYYGTTNFFGGRRATNVGSSERLSPNEEDQLISEYEIDPNSVTIQPIKWVDYRVEHLGRNTFEIQIPSSAQGPTDRQVPIGPSFSK